MRLHSPQIRQKTQRKIVFSLLFLLPSSCRCFREGAGLYVKGEGAVCVFVCACVRACSKGFDTAIQALWLPWSRLPYMAIGVKEQSFVGQ